jgi:hypothetical protein
MMSAEQVLYTPDGRRVGAWLPHLMWYYPYLRAGDLGLTSANATVSFLGEGTALSAAVVPVRTAITPDPAP